MSHVAEKVQNLCSYHEDFNEEDFDTCPVCDIVNPSIIGAVLQHISHEGKRSSYSEGQRIAQEIFQEIKEYL